MVSIIDSAKKETTFCDELMGRCNAPSYNKDGASRGRDATSLSFAIAGID